MRARGRASCVLLLSLHLACRSASTEQPPASDSSTNSGHAMRGGAGYCTVERRARLAGTKCSSDAEAAGEIFNRSRDLDLAACCSELAIDAGSLEAYTTLAELLLIPDQSMTASQERIDEAIAVLIGGVEAGSGSSAEYLVQMLLTTSAGTPDALARAESALRNAERQGFVAVVPSLAYVLVNQIPAGQAEAIGVLEKWAETGDVESTYLLGEFLYSRAEDQAAKEAAIQYTRRSAAAGNERSRVRLAIHALHGELSPPEREAALGTIRRFLGPGVEEMLKHIEAYEAVGPYLTRDALRVLQRIAAESAEGAEVDGAGNED